MKIFIDTADLNEIKEAAALGMLDGVTTNPSLVSKQTESFEEVAKGIVDFVDGPVSLEVVATQWEEMVAEGKKLREYGDNVVVKIPMTADGLKATRALSGDGIPVNVTLIFQPLQALLAAKAGATFVSPFVGRHDDISQNGMAMVQEIVQIFDNYDFGTEVLVASARHPLHVLDAAKMGADVVTLPFAVLEKFTRHPLTDSGLQKFLADWEKVKGR